MSPPSRLARAGPAGVRYNNLMGSFMWGFARLPAQVHRDPIVVDVTESVTKGVTVSLGSSVPVFSAV